MAYFWQFARKRDSETQSMKISIIINADTRRGSDAECSTTGDSGEGSLHGVRSLDFLTDGVVAVARFFNGFPYEIILSIDEHEPLPAATRADLDALVKTGALKRWECSPKDHTRVRWNDHIYLDSLRLVPVDATHIVHLDQDTAMFRAPGCDIVQRWLSFLDAGWSYICQPSNGGETMRHASTRFFICKRDTLRLNEARLRITYYNEGPCLEHILGTMVGGNVLYPEPERDQYLIISWARYYRGLMRKLNSMPFSEVTALIQKYGINGPNDVQAQRLE
jgi:hypothetical protein